MKTLLYLTLTTLIFTGCQTVDPPDTTSSSDDDMRYDYAVSIRDSTYVSDETYESTAFIETDHYPDSAWTIHIVNAPYDAIEQTLTFQIEHEGNFDFGFTKSFGVSYIDTIYGSGYFDADTLYLQWDYTEITIGNGDIYHAEIHSY